MEDEEGSVLGTCQDLPALPQSQTSSSSSYSSASAMEEVLKSEMILSRILGHCRTGYEDDESLVNVKTFRLVHPRWNEVVLSCKEPGLSLCLPLKDQQGGLILPFATLRVEPRLARSIIFAERKFNVDVGCCGDDATHSTLTHSQEISRRSLHYLTQLLGQFGPSIEDLVLEISELPTVRAVMIEPVILMTKVLNLRVLEIQTYEISRKRHTWSWQFPPLPKITSQAKTKLKTFKFEDRLYYWKGENITDEAIRILYLSIVQNILDMAPSLNRLSLVLPFLPRLKPRAELKELSWEMVVPHVNLHQEEEASGSGFPYDGLVEFLQTSTQSLERFVVRLVEGADCSKCQDDTRRVSKLKHVLPVLPKLKKLVIENAPHSMLELERFKSLLSHQTFPNLETLVFHEYNGGIKTKSLSLDCTSSVGEIVIKACSLDIFWNTLEIFTRWRYTGSVFTNLTNLSILLEGLRPDPDWRRAHGGCATSFYADILLKSIFNKCSAIPTLKELEIVGCGEVDILDVINSLRQSHLFKGKGLRKFLLEFETSPSQRNLVAKKGRPIVEHGECATALAKVLLRTKHMNQVVLRNFVMPPSVLIPVLNFIEKQKLPVSFGSMESIHQKHY